MTHFLPPASAPSPQPTPPHKPSSQHARDWKKKERLSLTTSSWLDGGTQGAATWERGKKKMSLLASVPAAPGLPEPTLTYPIPKGIAFPGTQGDLFRRPPTKT